MIVSQFFFSFPFAHQNLFIISLYRCLFALMESWLLLKVADWINWISLEMRLAILRVLLISSLEEVFAFSVSLS